MDQRDIARLEMLVPSTDALEMLASEHDRRGTYANWEVCQRAALDTLLARLCDGLLIAWTRSCKIDSSRDTGSISVERILSPWDYFRGEVPGKIPVEFWWHFKAAGSDRRTLDWAAGDFLFEYLDAEYSRREGSAFSVFFDPAGLPSVAQYSNPRGDSIALQSPVQIAEKSDRGRKPAHWWADFAEELTVYALECGMPAGAGTEGQSELINAIFARLTEAGKPEPARSSVQPVINAVLRRWRSAGN